MPKKKKKWGGGGGASIFKVKVIVKAYIVQIWLFKLKTVFWTNNSFATKCSLMVDHHKPVKLKVLDYCVQAQGHSEQWKCHLLFVWTISYELLNVL